MFSTVSIACELLPSVMLCLSSQVSPAVLSALVDSEPAVCQKLWNAVLSVLKNITVRNLLCTSLGLFCHLLIIRGMFKTRNGKMTK